MINSKVFILVFFSLLVLNLKVLSKEDVFISYKINDEIITNIDIKKEAQYLIALNNQLVNLKRNEILNVAKESALREKLKKMELLKYFNFENEDRGTDQYIKKIYSKLKLSNKVEFEEYLNKYELTVDYVEKKIRIEMYWNQLIYEKYKSQVNIDIIKLKKKIKKNQNNLKDKMYQLSEIVFEINDKTDLDKKNQNIRESIKEIGFRNTANIYSISDSSKFGGDIGWIEETKLSKNILEEISKLNIGEHSLPMQIGRDYLILKIENIKIEKKMTDLKQELEKKIQFDTTRQLERFSKIYYNKVKINSVINEQ
jgi:peptidyl-prolyl cis-trans isomerase SurA